jgi:hypothetical protein
VRKFAADQLVDQACNLGFVLKEPFQLVAKADRDSDARPVYS